MTAPLLSVRDLAVTFRSDEGDVTAVRGMSFDVMPGEVLAVVGESGSGKSVTSLAIMGLLPRSARVSGSAMFDGRELIGAGVKELRKIRGKDIAMIFQDPMTALNPVFTVGSQIAEAITLHNDMNDKAAWERATELLNLVGIPDPKRRVRLYPHEYSGGMRQRAMIAMAIANEPKLLIADEPTTALDVTIQAQVLQVIRQAQAVTGAAMVLITHDLGVVAGLADRVNVMYAGAVFESGDIDDIFYRTANPYTLGLLGSIPILTARVSDKLTPIPGAPPNLLRLPEGCPFRPRCVFATEVCHGSEPDLMAVNGGRHRSRCYHIDKVAEARAGSTV
ncbi:MAG: ABC transporter ATP-binding protein [Actinomycetota bacterium]|nr:ABC transporter ATP-binding protein [Actinomycetota bacterium]